MKNVKISLLIVHISSIVAWILTETMGLAWYISGPSSEGKFVSKSIATYLFKYAYYVNPAIYMLTLAAFIAIGIYELIEFIKSKKQK